MYCKLFSYKSIALLALLLIQGCDSPSYEKNIKQQIKCPPGATPVIAPWGKAGQSLSCKMKHGIFIGYEKGNKIMEVEYVQGKPEGKMIWYDQGGNIKKTIVYKNGKKISEEIKGAE